MVLAFYIYICGPLKIYFYLISKLGMLLFLRGCQSPKHNLLNAALLILLRDATFSVKINAYSYLGVFMFLYLFH